MMKCYVFPILLLCLIYVPLKGQYGSAYNSDTTLVPGADTEDLAYLFQKARSLSELGNHLAAILTYQEILKIEPRNETALIELGEIAFRIDNWYLSVATMRELIALNPEDVESRRVMVEIFRTFRETAEELKVVFELVQINPSDTALLYRLSTLYEEHALYPE